MLKVELHKSTGNELVSGSIDLRISPVATTVGASGLSRQLVELGLEVPERQDTRRKSNSGSSRGVESGSVGSSREMSSTEDQYGALPPGFD